MVYTPDKILSLNPNQIFVFGSNYAGAHGKGAALIAVRKFGAKFGKGIGRQGQSYAIPTKDAKLHTLPLDVIGIHVDEFIKYAEKEAKLEFLVTKIGCGLAGYSPKDVAPLFLKHITLPNNIILPKEFYEGYIAILHRK